MASPRQRLPKRPVDPAEIAAYERDGVVCLRDLFDRAWLDHLAAAVEQAMAAPGPYADDYRRGGRGRFFGDLYMWNRLAGFRDFVFDSPAARIAGSVMRSAKVNFFYDQLLVKEPGTPERTPWHQDQPYWAVAGTQVSSIWLPLDPVAEDTAVEYIRGSHRWGVSFNPHHFPDDSPYAGTGLPELPDIEANRAGYDIARWAMRPGDCLVFQAMIVHGAPGNASATRRRALATRWTGDDATYLKRPGEVAVPSVDPGLRTGDPLDCPMFPRILP
jgi:ectoine hydroxylase-related dioxygenase (phytanoyl-CoA dioxygenase family)